MADSTWDYSPYRVRVYLSFTGTARAAIDPAQLTGYLADRAWGVVGAAWHLQIDALDEAIPAEIWETQDGAADWSAWTEGGKLDKVIWLEVRGSEGRWELRARELDAYLDQWGVLQEATSSQRGQLEEAVFQLLIETFAPVAQIEDSATRQATIRPRAGALLADDSPWKWLEAGDLLKAVIRTTDRAGLSRKIRPIDWTYLTVTDVDGAVATCRVDSGVRNPLGESRRGRIEKLALVVRPRGGATTVQLVSAARDPKPLAGYDVYRYPPDSRQGEWIGRTDRRGRLEVEDREGQLSQLVILHGDEPLARFPVVPGLLPQVTAVVVDDDARLAAEGFVIGLQERLVDAYARREVLLALARRRIDEQDYDAAREILEELRQLPQRPQFVSQMQQAQQQFKSNDERSERRIESLLSDTRQIVESYLRGGELEALETELRAASGRGR
jgi:hypothetical protein